MILNEFHVLEWRACAIGEGHSISILNVGICCVREQSSAATRAEDDCLGRNRLNSSGRQLHGYHTLTASIVHEQFCDEPFIVSLDDVILHRGLKKRMEHMKAGFVGCKPCPFSLHAAKRTNSDT